MAGFFGGETERMREQARACSRGGVRLSELVATVSGAIDGVTWTGPDAEAFRELWHGTLRSELLARGAEVQHRARELEAHAEEQDAASRDDGVFSEIIQNLKGTPFPGLGPLLPMPVPSPGLPLSPRVIDTLRGVLGEWYSGGGATGPQAFYGSPGYGDRGGIFGEGRPVGEQLLWNPTLWDGREIDGDAGYLDAHGGLNYSAGAGSTTDPHGNVTGTFGARGSAEIGLDTHANLPGGFGLDAGMRAGMEAYAEAGGTVGPDGFSAGARAGSGVYAEQSAQLTHEASGASAGMTQSYYVGADAHANAYSHVTRSADGEVNGWTSGFDMRAFAGGEVSQKFEATSPGGWFSGSTAFSEKAGYGAGLAAGETVSTDEVSLSLGGSLAAELGLGGATNIALHPNAIVESLSPGDYDLDEAIDDATGSLGGAGGWVRDHSPF